MKRLIPFLFIVILIYSYLGWRLSSGPLQWFLLSIPFLSILSFTWGKKSIAEQHIIYFSMSLLTYLLVFSLLRDLLSFGLYLLTAQDVLLLSLFAIVIGTLNALRGPRIKRVTVAIPQLPMELSNFKIAQISDLHIGPTIGEKYVRKVVNKINNLKVDLIALTGDIGDGPVQVHRNSILPLKNLKSNLGSFYVPGNHEYYWNANEWMGILNNLGIIILVNRGKILTHQGINILIAGVPDPVSPVVPSPEEAMVNSIDSQLKILLSHRPDMAQKAEKAGFDLMLAGHTHGGQFFPWTLVVKYVHKFHQGLYQWKRMSLYVSPGTGSWGPFLRLGTNSEITLLELVPGPANTNFINE